MTVLESGVRAERSRLAGFCNYVRSIIITIPYSRYMYRITLWGARIHPIFTPSSVTLLEFIFIISVARSHP